MVEITLPYISCIDKHIHYINSAISYIPVEIIICHMPIQIISSIYKLTVNKALKPQVKNTRAWMLQIWSNYLLSATWTFLTASTRSEFFPLKSSKNFRYKTLILLYSIKLWPRLNTSHNYRVLPNKILGLVLSCYNTEVSANQ